MTGVSEDCAAAILLGELEDEKEVVIRDTLASVYAGEYFYIVPTVPTNRIYEC
jgi:hypothetical protein